MKLQIKTTFDFGKLANSAKKLITDFREQTILTESKKMTNRLKAGRTIDGKMDGLSDAAKITRILRGDNPASQPLNASGKLLNSIKVKKTGKKKKMGMYGKKKK